MYVIFFKAVFRKVTTYLFQINLVFVRVLGVIIPIHIRLKNLHVHKLRSLVQSIFSEYILPISFVLI